MNKVTDPLLKKKAKAFGKNIRGLRLLLEHDLEQFGAMIGVSSVTLCQFESGFSLPMLKTVLRTMDRFDVTFEWLFR